MKAACSALMYSGGQNPEKVLTDDELTKIKHLICQLNVKSSMKYNSGLRFNGFVAHQSSELDGKPTEWGVYGFFDGFAQVWDDDAKDWILYYDTAGICAYLFTIMNDTLQEHYNGSVLAKYNEQDLPNYPQVIMDDFYYTMTQENFDELIRNSQPDTKK